MDTFQLVLTAYCSVGITVVIPAEVIPGSARMSSRMAVPIASLPLSPLPALRAFHAARRLRVGGVLINDVPTFRADHMPDGGMKNSGIGREGPRYAVDEMTESKLICWRLS